MKLNELDSLKEVAEEVCIFGFSIVENYKAFWAGLSPNSPNAAHPNKLNVVAKLYGPEDTVAVSPNNDTIYAGTILDLRTEPLVIEVPAAGADRYYSMQFIDILTDNYAYLGSRTTGQKAGTYMLVGPDWAGEVPKGIEKVISSPSSLGMTTTRVEVRGTDDLENAAAFARHISIQPLSEYLHQTSPGPAPSITFPAYFDAKTGDTAGFFQILSWMLQWQKPAEGDVPMLRKLANTFGVYPGAEYEVRRFSREEWAEIAVGLDQARQKIREKVRDLGRKQGCWQWSPLNIGSFGQDYLGRAAVAWKYIYAASPEEAIYPMATTDSENRPLDGATGTYDIIFPKNQLPPDRFFWSITLYNDDGFMVKNPINRYSIGDRTKDLRIARDGSLAITIASSESEVADDFNWLPAPQARFYVLLRLYGPSEQVVEGSYELPQIVRRGS